MAEKAYTDSALADVIKTLLKSYKKNNAHPYLEAIDQMMATNTKHMVFDWTDMVEEPDIQSVFAENPDRVIDAFARAIKETLQVRYPEYAESIQDEIAVRITNYPAKKTVREINSKSSGKFISIKAMLIRMSPVESIPMIAAYECPDGHVTKFEAKNNFSIGIPIVCDNPSCKHREFEILQSASTFEDYQILQLQELPQEMPSGKLPKTLGVFVHGDLVDSARMGDTVEITGIVRAEMSNEIKLAKKVQTYRHRLYANNILRLSNENDLDGKITEKEIEIIESIRHISEEDATMKIINSFAPHIQGHSLIKEALILTMIGSDTQILDDGTRVRGDINMFLVGDPGTAKSEMGKAAFRVAPRAFYASGRGSSGAGLTAATIQDKTTGAYMLEPGVTVLADEGLAIIDEFDKMKPEDRSALHEVMEQQSASISKGGITATLNARASIIAIANPVYGKYDPFKNLTENIPAIPIPLLTRFDMIFVVRDLPSREKDLKIAKHIISAHNNGDGKNNGITNARNNAFDANIFSKYLRVAKQRRPSLSKEAEDKIVEYYLKMRNSTEEDSGYAITPRQLEGFIRLANARAKFLLKDEADADDADRAIQIMEEMFKTSGIDVNTGKVDLGVLIGKPKSDVGRIQLFQDIMKGLVADKGKGASEREIVQNMTDSEKWDESAAKEFLRKMIRENMLYESTPGHYSPVS